MAVMKTPYVRTLSAHLHVANVEMVIHVMEIVVHVSIKCFLVPIHLKTRGVANLLQSSFQVFSYNLVTPQLEFFKKSIQVGCKSTSCSKDTCVISMYITPPLTLSSGIVFDAGLYFLFNVETNIAAIVLGAMFGVSCLIVIILICYLLRKKKRWI